MNPDLMFDSSDIVPSDAGDKLAHEAHHKHKHGATEADAKSDDKDDILSEYHGDKLIDEATRNKYKWSKTFKAAMLGAATFTLFTALFITTKTVIPLILPSVLSATGAYIVAGLLSAAIVGAVWQGVKTHFDADKDVDRYNEGVIKRFKEGVGPERDVKENVKSQPLAMRPPSVEPVVMVVDPAFVSGTMGHQHRNSQSEQPTERPKFLNDIIEAGPKSLNAEEIETRTIAERNESQPGLNN